MRKFGGVKITMQRVSAPQPRGAINLRTPGDCPCGKSCADCDDEWDRKLGITGRSADQYSENLAKVRRAELEGLDPYHTKQRRAAEGWENDWVWTPHLPPGTFSVPTTTEERDGKRQKKPRDNSRRKS